MPNYWLMKSEPDVFSIENLKKLHQSAWDGVRNYQARNYMRAMRTGDKIFFYHSSCPTPGIAGIAKVCQEAYPDHTSWDPQSAYFDAKSSPENPRWFMVKVEFEEQWQKVLPLAELKQSPALADMPLIQKGSRLSVMPVTKEEWQYIVTMLKP